MHADMESEKTKQNGLVFECMRCSHTGSKGYMLEHFIRSHVSTERAPWSCSLCGYRAISRSALVNHDRLFMHQTAERNNPGAPTTFVKSDNPYIVRTGQDIRLLNGPLDRDDGSNSDFSPDKKRRLGEDSSNRKMRRDRFINRQNDLGSGKKRISRFNDYNVQERPDMPEYDLQDMDIGMSNSSDQRGFPVYDYPSLSTRSSMFSRMGMGMPRRPDAQGMINLFDGIVSRDTYVQKPSERFGDGRLNGDPPEPLDNSYDENIDVFTYENLQMERQTKHVNSSIQYNHGYSSSMQMLRRSSQDDFIQHNRGISGQNGESADGLSRPRDLNRCRLDIDPESDANDSGAFTLPNSISPSLLSLNMAPGSANSVAVGQSEEMIEFNEKEKRIRHSSSKSSPTNTETLQISTTTVCPVGKVRRCSKNADQSAEVGSSSSLNKEKDETEVTGVPEVKVDPTSHVESTLGSVSAVAERLTSKGESSKSSVDQEPEHAEQQTHGEEDCSDGDSQDEDGENQLLEHKINELINALEPLKNISKALIALDHHMRRLLPMVENLAKEKNSPKMKKT